MGNSDSPRPFLVEFIHLALQEIFLESNDRSLAKLNAKSRLIELRNQAIQATNIRSEHIDECPKQSLFGAFDYESRLKAWLDKDLDLTKKMYLARLEYLQLKMGIKPSNNFWEDWGRIGIRLSASQFQKTKRGRKKSSDKGEIHKRRARAIDKVYAYLDELEKKYNGKPIWPNLGKVSDKEIIHAIKSNDYLKNPKQHSSPITFFFKQIRDELFYGDEDSLLPSISKGRNIIAEESRLNEFAKHGWHGLGKFSEEE